MSKGRTSRPQKGRPCRGQIIHEYSRTFGSMIRIRPFEPPDAPAVWAIFQSVVADGDAFAFDETFTKDQALTLWTKPPAHSYVATDEAGTVVGACFVRPNQPGRGGHVAN